MPQFAVKILLLASGERLPILINRSSGMPEFYPNLYAVTQLRQTNRAANTMKQTLHAIKLLLQFLYDFDIDLIKRIWKENRLFTMGEVDALVSCCRHYFLDTQVPTKNVKARAPRVTHIRSHQPKRLVQPRMVDSLYAANRIQTIHSYLTWLTSLRLFQFGPNDSKDRETLIHHQNEVLSRILARIPRTRGRNQDEQKEGLSEEVVERLLQVVDPMSLENPWKSEFCRIRNATMIYWLFKLGLRRGELLNVRIDDIKISSQSRSVDSKTKVNIVRRPDEIEDPRREQPYAKTLARRLTLDSELMKFTQKYILVRRNLNGARKHPYLFVADRTGEPLSLPSVNKLFQTIRLKVQDLSGDLHPHLMRHTWNDKFTKYLFEQGIGEAMGEQIRSYWMGWSPTSNSAKNYTRKARRELAQKASLAFQEEKMGINDD